MEEDYITSGITPQQCRLRDMTYSAPISVNVEYTRGKEIVVRQGKDGVGAVNIGRIPLMLRCDRSADHQLQIALPARSMRCAASAPSMVMIIVCIVRALEVGDSCSDGPRAV